MPITRPNNIYIKGWNLIKDLLYLKKKEKL